ncbi:MAG: KpsF/GutQ family sugar-phosphate isomerase [Phycisphaeraceae bacterium]
MTQHTQHSDKIESDAAAEAAFARQVFTAEADAVSRIPIGPSFHRAAELIFTATTPPRHGSTIVSGLGKSGLIGHKISATFASTGTPSHFLHPTEAMHGDLGRVNRNDVVILLSFGGNTEEVVALATILKQDGVPTLAIVGKEESDLARLCTETLSIGDVTEACPMNLAPTASTTAMLAMGDALALCVSRRRNFGVDDFRKVHPGGGLGRQLTPVAQAMRWKVGINLPLLKADMTVRDALAEAKQKAATTGGRRPGALLVVDAAGKLAGIFTDGDLRRLFIEHEGKLSLLRVGDIMTASPRKLTTESLVRDAVQMVREFRIDEVPVVDQEGRPVGLIDVQDLMALKVIEG